MVVGALLVGVVLAVVSVPVAAVAARLHMNSQSSFPDAEWEGDIDHGDYVEQISRRSWLGMTVYGSFMVPKPLPAAWAASLSGWIEPEEDPRPAFARMPFPRTEWMVDHSATGWPWRAAAGRMFNNPGVTPIQMESLIEVTFGSTFFRFPLRPYWPGLLANTLFYAVLALTLMVLLRWRRTRRRLARGLCVACGYELGEGVAVCPECGLEARRF